MDWKKVSEELSKPLDVSNVKSRIIAGVSLGYIEGWHAIAECNRIFGFGSWYRITEYNREVSRVECQVGKGQYASPGFKVGYEAKVRIIVGDVVRDGTGHGSQISKDLFDAIEGAAKGAETDAMKRALMTFGNPMGLALYDKAQENVGRYEPTKEELMDPEGEYFHLQTTASHTKKRFDEFADAAGLNSYCKQPKVVARLNKIKQVNEKTWDYLRIYKQELLDKFNIEAANG